jgi:hypothetical protein
MPTKTMSNQELAAFVAMLFWMDDSSSPTYAPFASFAPDQVAAIQAAITNGTLPASTLLQNIKTINQDPTLGAMLKTLQQNIGAMIQAIVTAGLWDGCKSASMNQVAQIANM